MFGDSELQEVERYFRNYEEYVDGWITWSTEGSDKEKRERYALRKLELRIRVAEIS